MEDVCTYIHTCGVLRAYMQSLSATSISARHSGPRPCVDISTQFPFYLRADLDFSQLAILSAYQSSFYVTEYMSSQRYNRIVKATNIVRFHGG